MRELVSLKLSKGLLFMFISIVIPTLGMFSFQGEANLVDPHNQEIENMQIPTLELATMHPVINFLGKSFYEIKQVLGEPDEEGYSELFGPHYYILFRHKEGLVRFCSPEDIENKLGVSIILGQGIEILGVKIGMSFHEIKDILGQPDFGPELGMDNLFYMQYLFVDIENQISETYISFSADSIDSNTHEAFVKWENYEYIQTE